MFVDETSTFRQLAIAEKYERFVEYLYPILQSCPRKHGIARDAVLRAVFEQVDLFIIAGKSKQPEILEMVGRLGPPRRQFPRLPYLADAQAAAQAERGSSAPQASRPAPARARRGTDPVRLVVVRARAMG